MIDSLDNLVINSDSTSSHWADSLCLDPIIISSVLATFRLSLLAFSQQLRLFNSGVRASLSSVNVLADNVRLVSSANILGTAPHAIEQTSGYAREIYTEMMINNKKIKLQIDCGASINIITKY